SLALGELEGAAGLSLAVLLALHHAAVTGQETALLEHGAQAGLVVGQRLGNAVAHRARLARKAAAGDRCDDVVLAVAVCRDDRLLEDHLQDGTREIGVVFLVVDRDLAGAWLDPDAGDGVLALAGGVGAARFVELLDVDRRSRLLRGHGRAEFCERGKLLSHCQALLFLRFSAATSSVSGCWAAWGCSAPA